MKVVILHCHFERGGVTQVVENQVRFLHRQPKVDQVVLVSGGRTGGLSDDCRRNSVQITINGFDYDSLDSHRTELGTPSVDQRGSIIAVRIAQSLAEQGVSSHDAVLHWHNHSLGKNTAAPEVVKSLADSGWRLLLQIHDFAEDNRPDNYSGLIKDSKHQDAASLDRWLYPRSNNIQYAALTGEDTQTLATVAGQSHWLANSVKLPEDRLPDREVALEKLRKAIDLPAGAKWSLYPVRGIRRKNVGEWILLTQLLPDDWYSGLTLAPTTDIEKRSYDRWKEVAGQFAPNAFFDVGQHDSISYADNLAACTKVYSTSVAEGFGMTFLEPWLAGREVVARRLPVVTGDLEGSGIDLSRFYDSIPIEGTAKWIAECQSEAESLARDSYREVPRSFQPVPTGINVSADSIDFAWLSPKKQIEVINRIATDHGFRQAVADRSSHLVHNLTTSDSDTLVKRNQKIIQDAYSVDAAGMQVMGAYRSLLTPETANLPTPDPDFKSAPPRVIDLVNERRPPYPCRIEKLP